MADIENNMKIRNGVIGGVVGGVVIAAIALGYKKFSQQPSLAAPSSALSNSALINVSINPPVASSLEFAIGKYNKAQSYGEKGWRMATEADWTDPVFQAALVQAHRKNRGWALLEEPLVCNRTLYVAEGFVMINGASVAEVGYNPRNPEEDNNLLFDVYPAMNQDTQVPWTTLAPSAGANWTVARALTYSNPPCLFVKESASGGKKTRRRKGSRKQKRGTRNH